MDQRKISKIKIGLASILASALTAFGGLSNRTPETTGNNPHSWNNETLTNIVQNSSNIPEQMEVGEIGKSFRIWYDFSGSSIDFSDTNFYRVNFHASEQTNSQLYGVGTLNTNGQGMCDFFIDKPSLSDTNFFLTNNAPMYLTLVNPGLVYGLEDELNYNAQSNDLHGFTYTQNLGEVIGGIKYTNTVNATAGANETPGTTNLFHGTNVNQIVDRYISISPTERKRLTGYTIIGLDPSHVTEN